MVFTGISDEAGSSIEAQINAHRELGWEYMELRLVDGKNVAGELPDEEFRAAAGKIEAAGKRVSAFASAIGNWSRPVTGDFSADLLDLKCSVPRMERLGTEYIRVMSWLDGGISGDKWKEEACRRLRELSKIAEDGGVILLHENCTGWGGLSARNMVELLEEVDSPAFKLMYDIGNTVSHGQDPGEFFSVIRGKFSYVHVKDVRKNSAGGKSSDYAYCGEGDAMVEPVLEKIINEDGYDGFISIEPHVAAIVHEEGGCASEEEKYHSYVQYGKRLAEMIERIKLKG